MCQELIRIILPERFIGDRLDSAIAEMLPEYSRTKISAWIKSGYALIDHQTFKPKDRVAGFETVVLKIHQYL